MVKYRWTCNACGFGNAAEAAHCSECGCVATASAEEIERVKDPKKYYRQRVLTHYRGRIQGLLSAPMLFVWVAQGEKGILGWLALIYFQVWVYWNRDIASHLYSTGWARYTATIYSLMYLGIAIFFPPTFEFLFLEQKGLLLWLMISQFYIFFLSKSGKDLYLKYYREVGKSVENLKART